MTEAIGSFEMINVIEAKNTEHGGGDGELIENTSQYKVVTVDKLSRNSSGIWKYFGIAEKENATPEEQKQRVSDRILCLLCFQKGQVHVYKKSTSSGNLWRHLHKKHSVPIPKERVVGAAIRVKTLNGNDLKFGDKFIFEDEDATTLFSTDLDITNLATVPVQKLEISAGDVIKTADSEDIFKDIGSILITEISKRPGLYEWNPSEVGKKAKRDALWQEVYEALGQVLDIDRLQKMWKNIRDRYKKLRNLERQGISDTTKYKYYDQLRFLDCDAEEHVIISENHMEVNIDCTDDLVETFDESFEEPLTKKYKPNENDFTDILLRNSLTSHEVTKSEEQVNCQVLDPLSSSEEKTHCFSIEINSENRDDEEPEHIHEQISRSVQTSPALTTYVNCPNAILDEFDLFGRFIAEKMRKLPRSYVDDMEIRIMELLRSEGYHNQ